VELADGRLAHLVFTDRSHGDLRDGGGFGPQPWTILHQVHGARVIEVTTPGAHRNTEADAAVTRATGAAIAVRTADCAPVALVAVGGAVAVVHAGWKGLLAGIVHEAVAALRALAGEPVQAWLGPCIHAECYEFSEPDLEPFVARFGPSARSVTATGRPALDLPAAVAAALSDEGIAIDVSHSSCTACGDRWFSHRARTEAERQVVVAWIDESLRGEPE
jgi:polyphenol oxidase